MTENRNSTTVDQRDTGILINALEMQAQNISGIVISCTRIREAREDAL